MFGVPECRRLFKITFRWFIYIKATSKRYMPAMICLNRPVMNVVPTLPRNFKVERRLVKKLFYYLERIFLLLGLKPITWLHFDVTKLNLIRVSSGCLLSRLLEIHPNFQIDGGFLCKGREVQFL